jgi:hypothetical protein
MRNVFLILVTTAALASSVIAGAGEPLRQSGAPAPAPERDGAVAPIDCPLHQGGVDPRGMRPFAETEKWIEYLDKPERAEWQKPDADMAFACDVVHHVSDRDAWLHKGFQEMKPGARLVVIEFREGKLPQGPPEAMKIPKAKLLSMLEGVGFELRLDRPELLPYQHFLVFEKPAAAVGTHRLP